MHLNNDAERASLQHLTLQDGYRLLLRIMRGLVDAERDTLLRLDPVSTEPAVILEQHRKAQAYQGFCLHLANTVACLVADNNHENTPSDSDFDPLPDFV